MGEYKSRNLLDGSTVVIDSGFPTAVVFLNVGVIVVHLGVVRQSPQSRPAAAK